MNLENGGAVAPPSDFQTKTPTTPLYTGKPKENRVRWDGVRSRAGGGVR